MVASSFAPVAVVGRACLLPGASTPQQLWDLVLAGRDVVRAAPSTRWGVAHGRLLAAAGSSARDRTWSDRGGYVEGFEALFDPEGFAIPAADILGLDPVFQWLLHTAREALRDAGGEGHRGRVGAVFGNLSFPSASMSSFAEAIWSGATTRPDARNRFSSGLPALLLERALDLEAGAFALDAACASSLVAIKTACDWLHDGRADTVLAGAVNCADDLFIHVGFSALGAMSPSGRSRPFHAEADGLVPAEGAGFVALRRLDDAERDGDTILAVLRGVGLSNDGRGKGFLVPSEEGQSRALRHAYEVAGLSPGDVSLLECHATGTTIGDATELRSIADVFGGRTTPLPIGSLKSNMGHLITAAGVAGLLKVIEAMRSGTRPPTLHVENPTPGLDVTNVRLLTAAEPWEVEGGAPRRAGISAFGFGGNNAHLIVEEYVGARVDAAVSSGSRAQVTRPAVVAEPLAIVALGVVAADCNGRARFTEALLRGESRLVRRDDGTLEGRATAVTLDVATIGVPPSDLRQTLGQQLLMLEAAREAVAGFEAHGAHTKLHRERSGVFVGMGVDAEVARYGMRWRLGARDDAGPVDGIVEALTSAGVIGTMPNMCANRLNRLFDLGAGSCTTSAEEHSGLVALELAARALRCGEIDAALVGAVDLSCEPVHEAAARECLRENRRIPGDAAVALVVRRLADAERDGDRVYAVLEDVVGDHEATCWGPDEGETSLTPLFGHAHAASGLLHLAAAALTLHHKVRSGGSPWLSAGTRRADVRVVAMDGLPSADWRLREQGPTSALRVERTIASTASRLLRVYDGADVDEVLANLEAERETALHDVAKGAGGARLVLVAEDEERFAKRRERAIAHLRHRVPAGEGVHFRSAPVRGDLAFVFTSAGSAYHDMGRELLGRLPELGDRVAARFKGFPDAMAWVYGPQDHTPSPTERLWGASCLSQVHSELTLGLLGLRPQAAIGYSSGETNSLFALGAWTDMDDMRREIDESGLFTREVGGSFRAVARAWGVGEAPVDWAVWNVFAPVDAVRAAIVGEERVHLAIVHTANDCVLAGDADACRRIASSFGVGRSVALDYNLAAHVPELGAFREQWIEIHRRRVSPVDGVRFYSAGAPSAYQPEIDACADAILRQALATLDYPAVIERAWADGVRVFVEHGPQAACSGWIRAILGERRREAVIVPLDQRGRGLDVLLDAVAALVAASVDVSVDALLGRLEDGRSVLPEPRTPLRLPAHPAPVRLAASPANATATPNRRLEFLVNATPDPSFVQIMEPAPRLAPVGEHLATTHESEAMIHVHLPATTDFAVVTAEAPIEHLSAAAVLAVTAQAPTEHGTANAAAARWAAQFERVADVHRRFVDAQASVHESFLALRSRIHRTAAATASPNAGLRLPATPATHDNGHARPSSALQARPPQARPMEARPPQARPVEARPPQARPTEARPMDARLMEARPAVPRPIVVEPAAAPTSKPTGFALDRRQLEIHASGNISEIFGPRFAEQDGYTRQVRMPQGALLLADRMTGIEAEPGSMGKGRLWTETDVSRDSWYLHEGRMPAGIMIESGQADLLLISYLGADFLNRGERVYRLLGCKLTWHGDLPRPGDTLRYEIHVDGHASHDGVRLFFFHYDCWIDGELRLEVRGGQAGFFTDEELASSAGVLWDPRDEDPSQCSAANARLATPAPTREAPRVDPPAVTCSRSAFRGAELRAFAEGRPWECFGPGFEFSHTHTRTPTIAGGRMLALGEVTDFDPEGGPWGRGYLRAETDIHPDDWFFDGHFKNDPCMPGTLMFEGCLQAMSVYLAAMGFTLARDGWRFQPLAGKLIDLSCRGQVTPQSSRIVYEVFVDQVLAGPKPTLVADLLCTVDGRKAFHARGAGLELVPDWPLTSRPELLTDVEGKALTIPKAGHPPAHVSTPAGDVVFDYASLLACAWGRPSDAFGEMYARFDGTNRIPRLPGPPYHFLSRVVEIEGEIGVLKAGAVATFEYDIPADAWYFDKNGCASMPFCVLLEAALQPCGWLASYVGSALTQEGELFFRNLDGSGTQTAEIGRDAGILVTRVKLTNISKFAGMIILGFEVTCTAGEAVVYTMTTVFGFFPGDALANQVGLPTEDEQRAQLSDAADFLVDLTTRPARYCGGNLALPEPMLLMLDRVTGYWPAGGAKGLGRLRAEKDVDPAEWFFKAHFFQDPVQPGSLGIEALIQLVQFYMLERGMDEGIAHPRFEPLALDRKITWKYRGQVVPTNGVISSTVDIVEVGRDERGPFAVAEASLWVDGRRIYETVGLAVRIVAGEAPEDPEVRILDPDVDRWLGDHRPTWNRPALPMMSMVDEMAGAVAARVSGEGGHVIAMNDVQVKRWLDFDGPRSIRTRVERRSTDTWSTTLLASDAGDGEVEIATALVKTGEYLAAPEPLDRLDGERLPSPYANAALFHGPAFQVLVSGILAADGASTMLDAGAGSVPRGLLHPALLDGALHGIPHDRLHLWSPAISGDEVAYPARLVELTLHGPTPTDGQVRCEVRFDGFLVAPSLPRFRIQLITPQGVWASMRLVEACFPKGHLGAAEPLERRGFLRDRRFVEGLRLSRVAGEDDTVETRLRKDEVAASDWMPGTIEGVYGTTDVEHIAVKEHLAARERLHPRFLSDALPRLRPDAPPRLLANALPLNRPDVEVRHDGDEVVVRDSITRSTSRSPLDLGIVEDFWKELVGAPADWIGRDLWSGLMQRFVRRVVVTDPEAFAAQRGRSAIFVANHQVQIESLLVTNILSALTAKPLVTLANAKHEGRWIGWILGRLFAYPGCRDPESIVYFDPNAPESMADILARVKPKLGDGSRSFFVHVDGTRSRSCRTPVARLGSLFLDMAIELDVPVVPVRFVGGLPVAPIEGKAEFPVGMGRQDYFVGEVIAAEKLRALPYRDRARHVIAAINDLGVANELEEPLPGDAAFAASVDDWSRRTGTSPVEATFFRVLETMENPGAETRALLDGAARGELVVADDSAGRWMASFARALYGRKGPAVRIGR